MEYPKIQTLLERDEKTFVVDPTKLKKPVFETISEWDVTEKVDGMNIRVMYSPGISGSPMVNFAGRTDAAQIPGDLLTYLQNTFTVGLLSRHFQAPVVLYGEGYGAGIQKVGKLYRPDKSFILFDVLVDGKWWLNTVQVRGVATSLEIDVVPYLGRMTLNEIIDRVRNGFLSNITDECVAGAEGIVARPIETLFDSRHERVILKLKTKDFVSGKI